MWYVLAVFVVALIAVVVMMPSISQTQKAKGIDDIEVPTNGGGREIPVLFGTTDIASLQVGWYGNFKTIAIKK